MKKVAVALSGGVDSGVAAALLVEAGYQCVGYHLKLWHESPSISLRVNGRARERKAENKCCSTESLEAARRTAHQLGMPFYVLDFQKVFKKKVVDYFLAEYAAGNTPNPCVICNKLIKFGELLDYVRKLGYDFLATGHYARIVFDRKDQVQDTLFSETRRSVALAPCRNLGSVSDSLAKKPPVVRGVKTRSQSETSQNLLNFSRRFCLLTAIDESKDQSYFLYSLTQRQLTHVLFPVGDYLKKEVRVMAKKWELPVAEKPESQEICFFPETDYRLFLQRKINQKIKPGEVIDTRGNVIGKHKGLPLYTVGQRHGFSISTKSIPKESREAGEVRSTKLMPPFYVIDKDIKRNQLIVGFGKETEKREFWVKDVSWSAGQPASRSAGQKSAKPPSRQAAKLSGCYVRIRHQGQLLKCKIRRRKCEVGDEVKVILDEPERGIAPGQAAVFYSRVKKLFGELRVNKGGKRTKGKRFEILGGGVIL